jgi:hypothetical protein
VTIDYLRTAIRTDGHRVTPYRLGLQAGRLGLARLNPYPAGTHGDRLFRDGVRYAIPEHNILRAQLRLELRTGAWYAKATGSAT